MTTVMRFVLVLLLVLTPWQMSGAHVRHVGVTPSVLSCDTTHASAVSNEITALDAPADEMPCPGGVDTSSCVSHCSVSTPGMKSVPHAVYMARHGDTQPGFAAARYADFFPPVDPRPPQVPV